MCGDENCAEHPAISGWTGISGFDSISSGNYYLTADVTLTDQVTIATGTDITLCLNGHTITAASSKRIFNVNGGSLTLCDCKGTGRLTGSEFNGDGSCVFVGAGGTFTMYGGAISGNTATNYGGGVCVSGGTFTMYGGTISDNNAIRGGGVYVYGSASTFTMYDGAISGNTASYGGGVYIIGSNSKTATFTMHGGTISGNTASYGGGGVYQGDRVIFTMNGGTISDNTVTNGYSGGVCVGGSDSTFTMNGGTISSNTAATYAGGVSVKGSGSTFTMNGGTISGNTAFANGGGVYNDGAVTLNGKVDITGNKKNNGSADNVFLWKPLIIGSDFLTDSKIGVTTATAPTDCLTGTVAATGEVSSDISGCFSADKAEQRVVYKNNTVQLALHSYSDEWSPDDTNHWHECTSCGDKTDETEHTFVDKNDETNHWQECSVCDYKKDETAHSWSDWTLTTEPTLNTTGTAERTCGCGENQTKTDIPKLTDTTVWTKSDRTDPTLDGTGSDEYISDDYGKVRITIPKLTDTTVWTKGEHIDPTLNDTGSEKYTSTDYGDVTTTIPELTDTTVWTKGDRTDPTLDGTGSEEYTSTDYGKVTITIPDLTDTTVWTKGDRTDPTLDGTGSEEYISDDYGKVTITIPDLTDTTVWTKGDRTDPTLDGTGSEEYTSDDYGKVTITIPALTDPTWEKDDTQHVDPTEEDNGKDVYKSDDYGEVTVILPQLDHTHDWGNWNIKTTPTLTTTGTVERVCTKNNEHTDTKTLPVLTDNSVWTKDENRHVEPTEEDTGKDVYTSEYGEVEVVLPVKEHTHDWGNWSIKTAPTLTTTGTAERACKKDGTHKETKELPELTDTTVWTKVDDKHVDPTEEDDGKDVYTSEYGEVTDVLPALGHTHDWGKWTITTAPTLTETGTAQRVCTLNNTHIETKTLPVLTDTSVWTKDENKHVPPTEQTEGEDVYTSEYGEVINQLDKLPHTHDDPLKYVPEVKPTEDDNGVKEHWHCDGCGKDFADGDGTKEVTADELKIGKIKTEVQAPATVPKPKISTSQKELIAAILTEEEQEKVDEGMDIKIILKVEDASDSAPPKDKTAVETAIGNLTDHKLGQYLDITLLKQIGGGQAEEITETNSLIKIMFEIPESIRGKAKYSVIRVHNGTATVLPDLDKELDTVTIETDKFSTYALTYQEKATSNPSGGNPGGSTNPPTPTPGESDNSDTTSNIDNSSDTTSNGSDTNSSGGTSSSDESNHASSESSPSENNGNPSTGIAVSLVPLTAALAAMVVIAKRRRK